VPLDAESALSFNRLDHAARCAGRDAKTAAEAVDRLVMRRPHRRLRADEPVQHAPLLDVHVVDREDIGPAVIESAAHFIADVLPQGSTEMHVEELHAVADTEDAAAGAEELAKEREFPVHATAVLDTRGLSLHPAPEAGSNVVAARQDEGVAYGEKASGIGLGSDESGNSAGP